MTVNKKLLTLTISTLLLFPVGIFSEHSVSASEVDNRLQESGIHNSGTLDIEFFEKSAYYSISIDGDNFTISLSDFGLYNMAKDNGIAIPNSVLSYKSRAAGKTTITGKISSGNYQIYIKAGHLSALKYAGFGLPGLFGGLPGGVVSLIANIVNGGSNFTHGRVFVYQGYRYQYWYYQ